MAKYGKENIQFNLLALVGDRYESKSDELEMLKRERAAIERRLDASPDKDWRKDVSLTLAILIRLFMLLRPDRSTLI